MFHSAAMEAPASGAPKTLASFFEELAISLTV